MSDKNKDLKIKDTLRDLFEESTSYVKDSESNGNSFEKNPRKLKKVIITRSAYNKMIIIAQEVSKLLNQSMEVYALCIGNNGIIEDILIPHQKVSSISIHINASEILSLAPYIRTNNLNIIGWVHSHGDMSAFFSSTDDSNQITVLNDTSNYTKVNNVRVKYCFGITVNLREELFGIVTTQFPSGNIVNEKAIFEIKCYLPPNWNEYEIRREISEELEEKIKRNFKSHKYIKNFDDNTKLRKKKKQNFETYEKNGKNEKNLLSNYDRYIIDAFLKKNNISNPKSKRLLINFVKFISFNKNSENRNDDD